MSIRYAERATRNHSRQRGLVPDSFDRVMDRREHRAVRHRTSAGFLFGIPESSEIERRSFADPCAPGRS